MAEKIDWSKNDPTDPRFYKLDPNNPNTNISASKYDPTDPTSKGNPVGEAYNKFLQTANIGDTFDFGAVDPTQKGIGTKFVGFNEMGTPIIQTTQSDARTNWQNTMSGATSFSDAVNKLKDAGFDNQMAQFLVSKSSTSFIDSPKEVTEKSKNFSQDDSIVLNSSLITPTPRTPTFSPPPAPVRPPAKTAPIDTVLFEDDFMSPETMIDLVFEDIGGHELLSISRNDIINGQRVSYSPIKNLGLIQQNYNPNNLLSLQQTSEKYFANFAIKFEEKVPEEGNGENGVNVYIEEATGDLIIETVNMNNDEQVESEISINGTIYEANFGETVSW